MGNLLKGQTVGVIGAGRIGSAYARMMVSSVGTLLARTIIIIVGVIICSIQNYSCKHFLLPQIEGFKMNLIYYDLYQSTRLEKFVTGMHPIL